MEMYKRKLVGILKYNNHIKQDTLHLAHINLQFTR